MKCRSKAIKASILLLGAGGGLIAGAAPAYAQWASGTVAKVIQPGEGGSLAVVADAAVLPGALGRWISTPAQKFVRDEIVAQERSAAPPCNAVRIIHSYVLAPVIQVSRVSAKRDTPPTFSSMYGVDIDRCGERARYIFDLYEVPGGKTTGIARPYDRFFEHAATDPIEAVHQRVAMERASQRASGDWIDLSVALPAGWRMMMPDPNNPETSTFRRPDQDGKRWTELIRVSLFARASEDTTPVGLAEGFRAKRMGSCPADQEAVVTADAGRTGVPPTASFRLVCPYPDAGSAYKTQVLVGKILAGSKQLYLVTWEWRVPQSTRDEALKALAPQLDVARAMLDAVRVCDASQDAGSCPDPFFL